MVNKATELRGERFSLIPLIIFRQEQLQQETQGLNPEQQKQAQLALQQAETEMLRQRRNKISVRDFENIKLIGRGAFGEVWFFCRQ